MMQVNANIPRATPEEVDMTQTVSPLTHGSNHPDRRRLSNRPSMSLHGREDGLPTTWHVTMLDTDEPGTYLIEHAAGDIHSPAVWMQAQRDAYVADEAELLELVRRVMLSD